MADKQRFIRIAALCGLVGGTLQAIGGIVLGFMRQSTSNIDTFALGPELVFTLLQAMLLVGLFGLWSSGDVTEGSKARTLGRIALGAALLARVLRGVTGGHIERASPRRNDVAVVDDDLVVPLSPGRADRRSLDRRELLAQRIILRRLHDSRTDPGEPIVLHAKVVAY